MTPSTVAGQAPLSLGFSRQECWHGLQFPSAGDLPDPGLKPRSSALQAVSLSNEPPGKPYLSATQSVGPGLAPPASLGKVLDTQIFSKNLEVHVLTCRSLLEVKILCLKQCLVF